MLLCSKTLGVLRSAAQQAQRTPFKTLPLRPTPLSTPTWRAHQQVRTFTSLPTESSYMQSMYESWQANPASVHSSWDNYFKQGGSVASGPQGEQPNLPGDLRQQV